jgi:hypothetical protein
MEVSYVGNEVIPKIQIQGWDLTKQGMGTMVWWE